MTRKSLHLKRFAAISLVIVMCLSALPMLAPSASAAAGPLPSYDQSSEVRIVVIAKYTDKICSAYDAASGTNWQLRYLTDSSTTRPKITMNLANVVQVDVNDNPVYDDVLLDGDILIVDGFDSWGKDPIRDLWTYLNTTSNHHMLYLMKGQYAGYYIGTKDIWERFTGTKLAAGPTDLVSVPSAVTTFSDLGALSGHTFRHIDDPLVEHANFVIEPIQMNLSDTMPPMTYQLTDDGSAVVYTKNKVNNITVWYSNLGRFFHEAQHEFFRLFLDACGVPLKQRIYAFGIDDAPFDGWTTEDYGALIDMIQTLDGNGVMDWAVMGRLENQSGFAEALEYLVERDQLLVFHTYSLRSSELNEDNLDSELTLFDEMIERYPFLDKSMFQMVWHHGTYNPALDQCSPIYAAHGYRYVGGAPLPAYNFANPDGVYMAPTKMFVDTYDPVNSKALVNCSETNEGGYSSRFYIHMPQVVTDGHVDPAKVQAIWTVLNSMHLIHGSIIDSWWTVAEEKRIWSQNEIAYSFNRADQIMVDNFVPGIMFQEKGIEYQYVSTDGPLITARYSWSGGWKTAQLVSPYNEGTDGFSMTARYTGPVAISVPASMDNRAVKVIDRTTGDQTTARISDGVLQIDMTAGHEYEVMTLSRQIDVAMSPLYAIIPVVVMLAVLGGLITMVGRLKF